MLFSFEEHGTQRRQGQQKREAPIVAWNRLGVNLARIPYIAASIDQSIGIEKFGVHSLLPYTDPVPVARHRRKIEHGNQNLTPLSRLSFKGDDAVCLVGEIDPFKSCRSEIHFVKRGLRLVQRVQVLNELEHPSMVVVVQQCPIEASLKVPFRPLSKLAAHEQQLLAGEGIHQCIECTQVGKLLPHVARHLV